MAIDIDALSAQEQATAIYIAYYDRAPDPAGLQFWTGKLLSGEMTPTSVANAFANAAETKIKYSYFEAPSLAGVATFINEIYQNLFGRAPDAAGAEFWATQLTSGAVAAGEFILAVLAGAQDVEGGTQDKSTIENKIDVAYDWTLSALDQGIGTSQNPFAVEEDGVFKVLDANVFVSATTILDGVTGEDSSVVAAKAVTDAFFGGALGEIFNLTTGVDDIVINTIGTVDTVRGVIDNGFLRDDDTFSSGDRIQGNGLTEVRLSLIDGNPGFVEMEGVNALEFRGAGETGTVTFDASSYGTDLNEFLLSGGDNANVRVEDVEFDEGPLIFTIAEGTTGDLYVSGEAGPFTTFSADLETTGEEGASLISDIGNTGITAFAGEDADIVFVAEIDVDASGADNATIDSLSVGDVTMVAGEDADIDFDLNLNAAATGSGTASVGDVTFGNINLSITGVSGDLDMDVDRDANADGADATIGTLMIGDIVMTAGAAATDERVNLDIEADATAKGEGNASIGDTTIGDIFFIAVDDAMDIDINVESDALAQTGNATIGNLTIGDVSISSGDDVQSHDFDIDREAKVTGSGDAVVGDIIVGNISGTFGDQINVGATHTFTFEQDASASSGNASVGSITIGDISFDIGEEGEDEEAVITIDVSNSASATSGDASVGDVTIGNIDLVQASGSTVDLEINMEADAGGSNNGIVGNLTIGDITSVMGIDSTLDIEIDASASGTGTMTAIGDVTVGNVTLSGPVALGADVSLDIDIDSDGSIGAVTVGAVDVDFLAGSTFDYDISLDAGTSNNGALGTVLLGDVSIIAENIEYEFSAYGDMTAGVTVGDVMLSGDDIDWNGIDLDASADIGDVDIGNIMIDAASELDISNGIIVSATGDVGNVTIGDVAINFVDSDSFTIVDSDSFTINVIAGDDIGDVSVGNIDITATATAASTTDVYGYFEFRVSGDQDVGNISVGDISLLNSGGGSNYGSGGVFLYFDAGTGDDLGNVTVGDINLTSMALGFDTGTTGVFGSFSANIGGNADTVGDVIFGNITLNATAENNIAIADTDNDQANPRVGIFGDLGSTLSSMTIGDIDITLTNSVNDSTAFTVEQEYNVASADVSITSDSAITVGDISVSAVNESTVDVQTGIGPNGLFDFNVDLTADDGAQDITIGDITVAGGDVDAAGVVLDNLGTLTGWLTTDGDTVTVGDIDYSGYTAAAMIDVSDFEGAENITAASDDTAITVNATQNLVTLGDGDDTVFYEADEEAGTTYADIDKISNFDTGSDTIDFSFLGLENIEVGGAVADYDAFLTAAQTAMSFDSDIDVFALNDGTNTYVAVDTNNDDDIDFVIELTGITNVNAADFTV